MAFTYMECMHEYDYRKAQAVLLGATRDTPPTDVTVTVQCKQCGHTKLTGSYRLVGEKK